MRELKRLKVALVGMMTTPFCGPKEKNYIEDAQALKQITAGLEADLIVFEKGIYDLKTAIEAAVEFKRSEIDLLIIQSSSFSSGEFIYPFMDLYTHIAFWAVPEGEPTAGGGLPLNSFTAMNMYNSIIQTRIKPIKRPIKWFFGHADEKNFVKRIEPFLRALRAEINLRESRIGLIGGVAQGFDNLIVDFVKLKSKIGVQAMDFGLDEVYSLAEKVSDEKQINQIIQKMIEQSKSFSSEMEKYFRLTARFQLAFQNFVREKRLDALAISCWPRFQTDYQLGICTLMGQLNEIGIVSACEGDIPGALGMLTLHYLGFGNIATIMDLATIDPDDNSVLFWHCGPSAPSLADEHGVEMQALWLFDGNSNAPIGLHNNMRLKPGAATILGFYPDIDRMLVFEGCLDNQKPSYTGSSAWIRDMSMCKIPLDCLDLVQTIMESGYQHHYPLAYGSYENAALELARILSLNVVKKIPHCENN